MQAGGARKFLREEIDLALQDLHASEVVVGFGLGEFSAGLRKAAPKRLQRLLVQDLQSPIVGNREVSGGQIGLRRRIGLAQGSVLDRYVRARGPQQSRASACCGLRRNADQLGLRKV